MKTGAFFILIFCFVLFVFDLGEKLFDSKRDRYAQYEKRGEWTCPKGEGSGCEHESPFPTEDKKKQISDPHRRIDNGNNEKKQKNSTPILALLPYPL